MTLSASRLAGIGLAAVVVLALGTWVYVDVQRELRTLVAANLRSLLDTQVSAMETWIREKQLNVDRWAKSPRIMDAAAKSTRLNGAASDPSALLAACRGAISDELIGSIDELRQSDAAEGVNLVDARGRVLAARTREYCGLQVTPERLRQLAPVFEAQSMFAPPISERERLGIDASAPAPWRAQLAWSLIRSS